MTRVLIIFMIVACHSSAFTQDTTFLEEKGIPVELPGTDDYSFLDPGTVVIENPDEYLAYFSAYDLKKLPEIDFGSYQLTGISHCGYCEFCPPERQQCHRNACTYRVRWWITPRQD